MIYNVGTKVKMSLRGKTAFRNSRDNPSDLIGTVLESDRKTAHSCSYMMDCIVKWDNGCENSYDYIHLEPLVDLSSKSLEDYL